jgi:hypothetical protein
MFIQFKKLMILAVIVAANATFLCASDAQEQNQPRAEAAAGRRFVPLFPCRILDSAAEPPASAAEESSRHVDLRATRCGRIVPAFATAVSLKVTKYARTAPENLPHGVGPVVTPMEQPMAANGGPFDLAVHGDGYIAVDIDGYYVAPDTPVDPTTSGSSTGTMPLAATAVESTAARPGQPAPRDSGSTGSVNVSVSDSSAAGVLMTTVTSGRPWIVAKGATADAGSGFSVMNSANADLMHVRSDGAVQLYGNAFFEGRTDFFGSPGSYYGFVAVPTNIVHDVTLVDPQDANHSDVNRVVFFNAQTDAEAGSPGDDQIQATRI